MRTLLTIAGAALALAACSGADNNNEADTLQVNNLIVDDGTTMNADMNARMPGDANMMRAYDMDAMNTQELQQNDLATNDADTNLSNGL
jgi:ABC-type antimicrobial peptide transport system permease subunit